MTKIEALLILIKHTYLLSENEKTFIRSKLDDFTESQVEQLGVLLALEKKAALEANPNILENIAELIKHLRKHPPDKTR